MRLIGGGVSDWSKNERWCFI